MNAISFSGKIPISDATIVDKKSGRKIPATVFEYDGKDKNDAVEFEQKSLVGTAFRLQILDALKSKILNPNCSTTHIYTVETKDGKIAANAYIEEKADGAEIMQLGANKSRYGSSGKVLVKNAGKHILKGKSDSAKLSVFAPVPDAVPFYTMGCNFKYDKNYNLHIEKKDLENK